MVDEKVDIKNILKLKKIFFIFFQMVYDVGKFVIKVVRLIIVLWVLFVNF